MTWFDPDCATLIPRTGILLDYGAALIGRIYYGVPEGADD